MRRPRLAGVLLLLTAVVLVFGWRFARDTGVRQDDRTTREAARLFSQWRGGPPSAAPPQVAASEASDRASVLVGRRVVVPREPGFTFLAATAEKAGGRRAAAIRFLAGDEAFLLLVVPLEGVFGSSGGTAASPFPGATVLSGERAGVSFALWRRSGLAYCLASDRDPARVFDVARRHFP